MPSSEVSLVSLRSIQPAQTRPSKSNSTAAEGPLHNNAPSSGLSSVGPELIQQTQTEASAGVPASVEPSPLSEQTRNHYTLVVTYDKTRNAFGTQECTADRTWGWEDFRKIFDPPVAEDERFWYKIDRQPDTVMDDEGTYKKYLKRIKRVKRIELHREKGEIEEPE